MPDLTRYKLASEVLRVATGSANLVTKHTVAPLSGTVELRSPGCHVNWRVVTTKDNRTRTSYFTTGPASGAAVYVEQGASISSAYLGGHGDGSQWAGAVRETGIAEWTWSGGTATALSGTDTSRPYREVWMYPLATPEDVRATASQYSWKSKVDETVTAAMWGSSGGLDRFMLYNADNIPAISIGGAVQVIGHVPGHANQMAVKANGLLELVTQVWANASPRVIYTAEAATYHEIAVSPDTIICAKNNTAAVITYEVTFWRV